VDDDDLVRGRTTVENDTDRVGRDPAAELHDGAAHVVYSAFRRT
jgi:hypothetical protein